jgi:glucose/arabinose dehydrogenase
MKRGSIFILVSLTTTLVSFLGACGGDDTVVPLNDASSDVTVKGDGGGDAAKEASNRDASFDVQVPPPGDFCGLPGSLVFTDDTSIQIPGAEGGGSADLSFLSLPNGFCAHYYATVPSARGVRVAPGGEVFVASPSTSTAGGAPTGMGAIVVVPDDDKDGFGDSVLTFQSTSVADDAGTKATLPLASVEGMLFTNGFFYYQDHTTIQRVPYTSGMRQNTATPTQMIDINVYVDSFHWPKTLDVADDGTIYVTNGSFDSETCVEPHVPKGVVMAIDGTPNGKLIAQGFRNPQYMRCQHGHNNCFLNELTKDFSTGAGGREKLVQFGAGQDWGFPCCASKDLPFPGGPANVDCSNVQDDTNAFIVGSTPFGLDFETGKWSDPYKNSVYISMHGQVGSWTGARVVMITTDPATGKPFPSSDRDGSASGPMTNFATGWDDGTRSHGRPSDLTFGADGRMYIANDYTGTVFWVAPIGLKHP